MNDPFRSNPSELGALEKRYAPERPMRMIGLIFVCLFLPGLLFATGYRVDDDPDGEALSNLLLGIAAVAVAVVSAVVIAWRSTISIEVRTRGLVWKEHGQRNVIRWNEIAAVSEDQAVSGWGNGKHKITTGYRIRLHDGRELVATSIVPDVFNLHERIKREVR